MILRRVNEGAEVGLGVGAISLSAWRQLYQQFTQRQHMVSNPLALLLWCVKGGREQERGSGPEGDKVLKDTEGICPSICLFGLMYGRTDYSTHTGLHYLRNRCPKTDAYLFHAYVKEMQASFFHSFLGE